MREQLKPTQIKAALTANGYPTTEGDILRPADIEQFRFMAFFLGYDMDTAQHGLAYPGLLPEGLYGLVAGDEEGGGTDPDPEPEPEPDDKEGEGNDGEPDDTVSDQGDDTDAFESDEPTSEASDDPVDQNAGDNGDDQPATE